MTTRNLFALTAEDVSQLATQRARLIALLSDGEWHRLKEMAEVCQASETGISMRYRELKKPEFGGYHTETRNLGKRNWVYRIVGGC